MSQRDQGEPTDGEDQAPPRDKRRAMLWLLGFARPYAGRLSVVGVGMLVSLAVSLALPYVLKLVVDATVVQKDLENLRTVIFVMIGLFALQGVLHYFESLILRGTAARLVLSLRGKLHAHLLRHSPAFYESQRVGDLLSRLTSDVDTIGTTLTSSLVSGLHSLLVLVGAITILLVTEARLTGLMLLAVPPVVLAAVFFGFRIKRLSRRQQKLSADANVVAEESFAGIRTIVAFTREEAERDRYGSRLESVLQIALRMARVWGAFGGVVTFLGFSAMTFVLWTGGKMVISGELGLGDLTLFLGYTIMIASNLGSAASLYAGLNSAIGATDRVRQLLETRPTIVDAPDARALPAPEGHIAFEGVTFRYPTQETDSPALADVDLVVEPGEVIALVGPSGGGKSTLVGLLLRFHDPQQGRATFDSHELPSLRLQDLRGAIGLVPQEIFIFGGTIGENIRYGRTDASDAEVEAAARAAHAWDFIAALPRGLDTLVGERGIRLSVGERQRLAIARVFLKDPAVVVLDEATSSLDAESEHLVQEALGRLFEGRTTLVVAHRLATVRRATRVILLDRGRVVEQGTHPELLEQNGMYRRFCDLQMIEG
jgi:subfamily B ATP-binding cassette protein MsbA